jgi:hypothetical protein
MGMMDQGVPVTPKKPSVVNPNIWSQEMPQPAELAAQDLKALAAAVPPCITILLPLPEPSEIHIRLKNAVRYAEKSLRERNVRPEEIEALLQPVQALAETIEVEGRWGNALVVLRSPAVFRHFWVRRMPREIVAVGEQFALHPLLSLFGSTSIFYVLALSQKHIHLFRCTEDSFERVRLPDSVPVNLNVWLRTRQPDHVLDNRAFGGPSAGSMRGVMFGTSTDREDKEENLLHFFREVDKGVHNVLKDGAAPLVLAGVEYEVALYRRVNTYPRLLEAAVYGSPESFGSELHARALQIVEQHSPEPLRSALAQFERYRGSTRVSFDVEQTLQAAHFGRVANLFLRRDNSGSDDDKINGAAIQTLLHGGQVFVLNQEQMPDGAALAALMRY